jgi:hypothetical protein
MLIIFSRIFLSSVVHFSVRSVEKFWVYIALLKACKSTFFKAKARALAKKNQNLPNLSPHAFRTHDVTCLRGKKRL